jgi:G3E family GTPase
VYRARRPFHPARFMKFLRKTWPGLLRSKGWFWLATRMDFAGLWSQAGGAGTHQMAGFWWAAVDRRQWPLEEEAVRAIRKNWKKPWGDRRQELVFIGQRLDEAKMRAALDACLLDDAEMARGQDGWRTLPDPFPAWAPVQEVPGHEHEQAVVEA